VLDALGNLKRTNYCGDLRASDADKDVILMGWVHRRRDLGQLIFIDLRDRAGLAQIVFNNELHPEAHKKAEELRSEFVVAVEGKVIRRQKSNPEIASGEVEVMATRLHILNNSKTPPFQIEEEVTASEETRLRHRYLDLRRPRPHRNIELRHRILFEIRKTLDSLGFFEIETPMLTRSTPEGARDYLVPSRIHPGTFYALPQAPQQFKQLLMVAGFDRYFQIAPCFRDEASRADRSPGEFYQLDFEMSFVTQDDVFAAIEPVLAGIFEEFGKGRKVTKPPFPCIAYDEALLKYGTDKPDLRNPIMMTDATEIFRGSGFKLFANIIAKDANARVWAIPAPGGGYRAFCDRMNSWAQGEGQPGMGYIFFRGTEGAGPVASNLGPERTENLRAQLGLKDGDAVFFVAGVPKSFRAFAGAARTKLGQELNLVAKDEFRFCWIVDFPMYEYNEETKKIEFSHNPFSMPQGGLEALEKRDPLTIKAFQYDIVCNGIELSSGAIRNHRPEVMKKAFGIAGYDESVLERKFGGMLHALSLGAPPHGGIAPGIDRIVMLLCGEENLREVVLFPMNQRAEDLMMGAPSEATPKQLRELHIRVVKPTTG